MTDHDEEGRERLDEVAEETSSGMSDHEEKSQEDYWNRTRIEKNYQQARGGRATSRGWNPDLRAQGVRCPGTGFLITSLISDSLAKSPKCVVGTHNISEVSRKPVPEHWCCDGALVMRSRSLVGLSQPSDAQRAKFSQHDPPEVHFEIQAIRSASGSMRGK